MQTQRDLVAEGYRVEPWLAPAILHVVKPNGERYILNAEEDTCSCPAWGDCCHRQQVMRLLRASISEYIARRELLGKLSANIWTQGAIDFQIIRMENAEWELWAVSSYLLGGDFLIPDTYNGYVQVDPTLETAWIARQAQRAERKAA